MKDTKKKIAAVWQDVVHDQLLTEEVFIENEIKANKLITKSMIVGACLLLAFWILNTMGVLEIDEIYVIQIFLVGIIAFLIPAIISIVFHCEKKWIKYMLLISATLILAYLDVMLTFNVTLAIILPAVFSCRYYSYSITIKTTILTSVLFAISAYLGAVYNFNNPDLNFASDSLNEYIRDVMLLSFLPKWMIFVVFSVFCCEIARCGRKMVLKQNEISQRAAKVNAELEMASRIQTQALPDVEMLGESNICQFDIAADMNPAKEVGGDFYDFFYADESHIALIIADVADKGIAASLYMMMSKTLLDSSASVSLSPGQILESVNAQLCVNNSRGMFVSAWLGILDLRTGEMITANAGHEYPVLCRKGGEFELIKDKHSLVLGGFKPMKYPEHTIKLNDGDTIFVYTDGVPEANNENGEMFGLEGMVDSLNRHRDCNMVELIAGVKSDIDAFVDGAPQFDDTTMLAFRMKSQK